MITDSKSVTEQNPIQNSPDHIPKSNQSFSKHLLIGISIGSLVAFLVMSGIYFLFLNKQYVSNENNEIQKTPINESPRVSEATITNSPLLSTFTDPNIEGMEFKYDSTIWDIIKLTREKNTDTGKHQWGGTGILLKEKKSGGSLLLAYNLSFGVGGGITTLKQGDLVTIKGSLSRVSTYNPVLSVTKYLYGHDNDQTHVVFSKSPDKLQFALNECNSYTDTETFVLFSEEECKKIKSGLIIGYLNQPAFSRSIRLRRISSLGKIDSSFENDKYIKEAGIDDGFITIESEYIGENPSVADKIISQFAAK